MTKSLSQFQPANGKPRNGLRAVLVDADDTLWENNIFFLECLQWLCLTGRRFGFSDEAVIEIMRRREKTNIPVLGYSYNSFETSLAEALRQLCFASDAGRREHAGLRMRARQWVLFLRQHPILFLPGVLESIPKLTQHYPVIIVTKGDAHDQMAKVKRSGLLDQVFAAEVVPEKYPANYRAVLDKYGLTEKEVVMIGNSPRSDINQAKRAGIRTIYVPHPSTWEMELEPILPEEPETQVVPHFGVVPELLAARD
jgi:putative hydrolase of the HAD superfamily